MKKRGKCCAATMRGINLWYDHMFEKLGWMVLAQNKGYTDKVISYKKSLQRLKQAIELKISQVQEIDRKNDLLILHDNLIILMKHVEHDFH